jgi:hypothetical protein
MSPPPSGKLSALLSVHPEGRWLNGGADQHYSVGEAGVGQFRMQLGAGIYEALV